jgi:hypothetical protein
MTHTYSIRDLLERGFNVLPLHQPTPEGCSCGKTPCGAVGKHPRTRAGVYDASAKWIDVVQWKQQFGEPNWAVACGQPLPEGGYLAVLDVDPRNGGHETLASYPACPPTLRQATGGAGEHYLFRTSEPATSAILGPGLELKGHGSYIVVSPSLHISGRTYSWQDPLATEIAPLPAWVPVGTPSGPRPDRSSDDSASTFLGRVAEKMGWLGDHLGSGKRAMMCPWSHEHSNQDWHPRSTGTVLLPATLESNFGEFKCFHAHCTGRGANDVIRAASEEARTYARSFHILSTAAPQAVIVQKERLGSKDLQGKFLGSDFVPSPSTANGAIILERDPDWAGVLGYDEMHAAVVALKAPPFKTPWGPHFPRTWQEPDDRQTLVWLQTGPYASRWSAKTVLETVHTVSDMNRFNRLTEELDNLVWDGVERIDTWLTTYLGADPTPYASIVGSKWLLSAVARAKMPGCKVDHVLVLEGAQGMGKSKALHILGGKWFSDDLGDLSNGKDSSERIRGKWIVEDSELSSLRRSDTGVAKAFVTRQVDYFREAYAKRACEYPRRCVFAGTVNNSIYLKDSTGSRRFWCVSVVKVEAAALARDRDQLWAEAVFRFNLGETWWADGTDFQMSAGEETEKRYIIDPFENSLRNIPSLLVSLVPLYEQLGITADKRTQEHERRLVDILARQGYKSELQQGKRVWVKKA